MAGKSNKRTRSSPLRKLAALSRLDPLVWAKAKVPASVPTRYANTHADLIALPNPGESQARVCYRGFAKTTLVRILVLHSAMHRRVRGILVVRNTYGDVRQDIKSIRATCLALGVPCQTDAESNLVVVNGVPIWLRTPGSSVRGVQWTNPDTGEVVRPELIVVDDLETRESARSQQRTTELGSWLTADVMATAGQEYPARTILLGTPITPTSLIARAMRQEGIFANWLPPLVVPIVDADGVPAWPATYNPALQGTLTDDAWATEYLLNPLPVGSLVFPPARTHWTTCDPSTVAWIGVDPAGDGADSTGIVATTLTARGLYVIDALEYTGHAEQMPMTVAMFVRTLQAEGWRVGGVMVEAVGGFTFAVPRIREQLVPVTVQHEAPRVSKMERALPMTLWHRHGHVAVAEHLRGSSFDVEMHTWARDGSGEGTTVSGHDDMIDAGVWSAGLATTGWSATEPRLTWAD